MSSELILPLIGIWLGCGGIGFGLMIISDICCERWFGIEPRVTHPDYILAGVLTLVIGLAQICATVMMKRKKRAGR